MIQDCSVAWSQVCFQTSTRELVYERYIDPDGRFENVIPPKGLSVTTLRLPHRLQGWEMGQLRYIAVGGMVLHCDVVTTTEERIAWDKRLDEYAQAVGVRKNWKR